MNEEIVRLLNSINEKLSKSKRDIFDKLSVISTLLSTVLIAGIGVYLSQDSQKNRQAFDERESRKDSLFRESELVQKFIPLLATSDSTQSRMAILGIYILDSTLAIKLSTLLDSKGSRSALQTIVVNATKDEKLKIQKEINKSNASDSVLLSTASVHVYYIDEAQNQAKKVSSFLKSFQVYAAYYNKLQSPHAEDTVNTIVYYNKVQLPQCYAVQRLLLQKGFGNYLIRPSHENNPPYDHFKVYVIK